jgi:8-oxo-dGTP diphosphatase
MDTPPPTSSSQHPATHPLIARGLISDEHGRWLIVRPINGERWHLPGGLVEQNEPLSIACVREIREELGLEMRPGPMIAVGWTAPRRPDRTARVTFIFHMGELATSYLESAVRLQRSEVVDWRLLPAREALNALHPDVAIRLAAYRGNEPTAVFVEHHPAQDSGRPPR